MTTDASPRLLLLSLVLLGLAFLLVSAVAFAAFVPLLQCPEHDQERDRHELNPCLGCNGYGRSTLFQRWNYRRYEQQQEPFILYRM